MKNRVFILEIEEGESTRWRTTGAGDLDQAIAREAQLRFASLVRQCTDGAIPRVTVRVPVACEGQSLSADSVLENAA